LGAIVPKVSRRRVLADAARGLAGAALAAWAVRPHAAFAQARARGVTDLGGGVRVLNLGATNVLAVAGDGGLALVDGAPAGQADLLTDMLASLPNAGKVHTLFNTHWHPEQTGSNEALGRTGAAIIAQENTKQWLTTDVTWPWDSQTVEPLPKAGLPNKTFFTDAQYEIGGKPVRCGHLRDCPHTDGDMYVFFTEQNVLSVGDAVYGAGWPSLDWWTGGWIGGLVGGLDMLYYLANDDTRIVPARGPVLAKADLRRQYQMYSAIWERLLRTLYSGGGPEEALAANPTKEFDAAMGPSEAFVHRAFESLWAYLSPDA
jgi:cyclase